MKNALFASLVFVLAFGCKHPSSPDPVNTFAMSAWVDYSTSPISIQLRGSSFQLPYGPVEAPFDQAEVYIADNLSGGYQLLASTSQTRLSLPTLKPGASYYIQVKGTSAGHIADSKPILVVNDVVQPATKWLPYDPMSTYAVSPAGFPIIQQTYDYTVTPAKYTTKLIEASGTSLLPAYTGENRLNGIGWSTDARKAFFETSKANKRAIVTYDLASRSYTDFALPTEARVWNYSLAPDGQQVVYTDYSREGLWYFDGRTNTQKKIDSPQTVYGLTWTGDSRHIWVIRPAAGDRVAVVEYDPQTGIQTALLNDANQLSGPQLSPDGQFVLYTNMASGQAVLWLQNRSTGVIRPVGAVNQYGWLNDGTFWAGYRAANNQPLTDRESFIWTFKP